MRRDENSRGGFRPAFYYREERLANKVDESLLGRACS